MGVEDVGRVLGRYNPCRTARFRMGKGSRGGKVVEDVDGMEVEEVEDKERSDEEMSDGASESDNDVEKENDYELLQPVTFKTFPKGKAFIEAVKRHDQMKYARERMKNMGKLGYATSRR